MEDMEIWKFEMDIWIGKSIQIDNLTWSFRWDLNVYPRKVTFNSLTSMDCSVK